MKIIEAMKQIKALAIKAQDLRAKIKQHCADLDFEAPLYADQRGQVDQWLQAHSDVLKEILRLRVAIQRTNIATEVTIMIGDKAVTKCIAEWIHRRRDLANLDYDAWAGLTDRGLQNGVVKTTAGTDREFKIRRYYDPATRDKKVDLYRSEPGLIDGTLEVVNAVTDLLE